MLLLAFGIVGIVAGGITVTGAVSNHNEAKQCAEKTPLCKNDAIAKVAATPSDRESIAKAALGVYGPVIQRLKASNSPESAELAQNLTTVYEDLTYTISQPGTDTACVRDGLVNLLVEDQLNTARTKVVVESLKASAELSDVLPDAGKALRSYHAVGAEIAETGTFLVGTYNHYKVFPATIAANCS